jgi:prephenate dehydrogenase
MIGFCVAVAGCVHFFLQYRVAKKNSELWEGMCYKMKDDVLQVLERRKEKATTV